MRWVVVLAILADKPITYTHDIPTAPWGSGGFKRIQADSGGFRDPRHGFSQQSPTCTIGIGRSSAKSSYEGSSNICRCRSAMAPLPFPPPTPGGGVLIPSRCIAVTSGTCFGSSGSGSSGVGGRLIESRGCIVQWSSKALFGIISYRSSSPKVQGTRMVSINQPPVTIW